MYTETELKRSNILKFRSFDKSINSSKYVSFGTRILGQSILHENAQLYNHMGGYTKTESLLDFSGTPLQAITKHKRLDSDMEHVITETFTYDNQNRLKVHKHKIDNNPEEILAQNEYNELSQLKR